MLLGDIFLGFPPSENTSVLVLYLFSCLRLITGICRLQIMCLKTIYTGIRNLVPCAQGFHSNTRHLKHPMVEWYIHAWSFHGNTRQTEILIITIVL